MKKKRIILAMVTLLSAINLCACGKTPSNSLENNSTNEAFTFVSYTTEELYEELSHEESFKEKDSEWELKYFVDDFGDPTNKKYVNNIGFGQFSNTATTNSGLMFSIIIDISTFSIKLYEYYDNPVINYYSKKKTYTIQTKKSNGVKERFSGFMYSDSGDRIYLSEYDKNQIITYLYKNDSENITFLITDDDWPTSKYKFTLECSGFKEAYDQLK